MAKRTKQPNPFMGRWRIVSMSAWDEDYLDEEVEAFIAFSDRGRGSFQFGYVQGVMDCRMCKRGEALAMEFSWEGSDGADGTQLTGRGWAIFAEDGLSGMLYIHDGDESDFLAKRSGAKKAGG